MSPSLCETPSDTMTSEYFKLLPCPMKGLAVMEGGIAGGEGLQRKMSAGHLSNPCLPSLPGHRSL